MKVPELVTGGAYTVDLTKLALRRVGRKVAWELDLLAEFTSAALVEDAELPECVEEMERAVTRAVQGGYSIDHRVNLDEPVLVELESEDGALVVPNAQASVVHAHLKVKANEAMLVWRLLVWAGAEHAAALVEVWGQPVRVSVVTAQQDLFKPAEVSHG